MRKTCLTMVHQLAKQDKRVVYIGSDIGAGTLDAMRNEFPNRFFVEGISEANVIGMAAGLAMEGYIPYVNTIATFLSRRCYEQVAVDLCMHNLPVRLIANGGGLVYAPLGPTHQAIEDIALMRAQPRMTVAAPSDADEMKRLMGQTLDWEGPIYIRLGKGGDPVISHDTHGFTIGKAIVHRAPADVTIISTGIMTGRALAATEILAKEGLPCGVVHLHTIKPIDRPALHACADASKLLVTVEEHTLLGGLGSAVSEVLCDRLEPHPPLLRLGIPDVYAHNYGSQDGLLECFGLQPDGLVRAIKNAFSR